jgi:hypothetical protein
MGFTLAGLGAVQQTIYPISHQTFNVSVYPMLRFLADRWARVRYLG